MKEIRIKRNERLARTPLKGVRNESKRSSGHRIQADQELKKVSSGQLFRNGIFQTIDSTFNPFLDHTENQQRRRSREISEYQSRSGSRPRSTLQGTKQFNTHRTQIDLIYDQLDSECAYEPDDIKSTSSPMQFFLKRQSSKFQNTIKPRLKPKQELGQMITRLEHQ